MLYSEITAEIVNIDYHNKILTINPINENEKFFTKGTQIRCKNFYEDNKIL